MSELATTSYSGWLIFRFWHYVEAWFKGQPVKPQRNRFELNLLSVCAGNVAVSQDVFDDYLWNSASVAYTYRNSKGEWTLPVITEDDCTVTGKATFQLDHQQYQDATLHYIGYGIVSRVGNQRRESQERISCPCWILKAKHCGNVIAYFYFATTSMNLNAIDDDQDDEEFMMFASLRAPHDQPVVFEVATEGPTTRH